MFKQRSDRARNLIHLVSTAEVTTTDLTGHRRTAILAARDLGRPFVVVNDLTECTTVSSTAAQELAETVRHLVPFGLSSELRLVSDDTPTALSEAFDHPESDVAVDVVTVPSGDSVDTALDAHLDRARC